MKLDPELVKLERDALESLHSDPTVTEAIRKRMKSRHHTLKRLALRKYQEAWVAERRDWKILTRGKERPRDLCKTELARNLCLLVPERGRLAQWMASDEPLSPGEMWRAAQDLHSLCCRDFVGTFSPSPSAC